MNTSSLLTPRMRKLLEAAADELAAGHDPFRLVIRRHEATVEEAYELASLLSLGARMVLEHL